jgi:hypothetical protein
MAVTTTPTAIAQAAFDLDKEFDADEIVNNATALLQTYIRAERGLWAFAARVNPGFFAKSASVAFASPGWARPTDAELIWYIENPTPARVIVVDMDQRAADPSRPAVYEWGQIFRGAGNSGDPSSGNLTFYYSKRPTAPATMATTLDALWEPAEGYNQLLALELAIYLKLRDGKDPAALIQQRNHWANLFVAFLEHATLGIVRNYESTQRFLSNTRVPLSALLAGGAPVEV